MKTKLTTIFVLLSILIFSSRAKDRNPTLVIKVVEANGMPAPNATVHAWPTDGPFAPSTNPPCIVDEERMDQTTFANEVGEAKLTFEFSAVVDVEVVYYKMGLDSLLQPIVTDTLSGKKVVKIEEKRQRSKNNNFNETIIVK